MMTYGLFTGGLGLHYGAERVGIGALALARSRLGDALRSRGHIDEAIPVLQQAVDDYTEVEGPDGQGTLTTLSSLGYLYSLGGNLAKALSTQRDVYQRTRHRWGEDNQYTLVELMNLGSAEYDSGKLHEALRALRSADAGLTRIGGEHSPTVQAARVAEASALKDLGQNAAALALLERVDPDAYQATTSDPGRAAVLRGLRAQVSLNLHRHNALAELRQAVADMRTQGVDAQEIATFAEAMRGN